MDSTSKFFNKVIPVFQCFGVAPRRYLNLNSGLRERMLSWGTVLALIVIYWMALIYCVATKERKVDIVNLLANYIQLLLNAIALTATVVSTVYNCDHFKGILNEFAKIDRLLKKLGSPIDYANHRRLTNTSTTMFLLLLFAVESFDFYVTVVMYDMNTVPYWMVRVIPSLFYGMALHLAALIIYFVLIRCRTVNCVLKRRILKNNVGFFSVAEAVTEDKTMKMVYQLSGHLHGLCDGINGYFGLTFLTSLLTMFAVSSIQGFYAFKIISDLNEKLLRNHWTFSYSVLMVILNLGCVSALAYLSDTISSEALRTNRQLRRLGDDLAIKYSGWLHPLLIHIKISVFGLFDLNLAMLCGFFTTWITYLMILVQYNGVAGNLRKIHKVIGDKPCQCPY